MNKVYPPLTWIVQFYWYYSSFTLLLTWLITPLLFYVILTQSKNLRTFKWLILNHSFWCFLVANGIGFLKPLIFLPAFAGFPLGLLRDNGSFAASMSMVIIGVIACVNCVIGLAATTFSRYLLAFPSKLTNWFNFKFTFLFILVFTIFSYLLYFFQFLPFMTSNIDAIRAEAIEYDPVLGTIVAEPGFFYAPRRYGNKMMSTVFFSCMIIIVISLIVMFLFVYLVLKFRKTAQTTTSLQRSLIISSIMQILLTILFLFMPVTLNAYIIANEIPNTTNLFCIIFCLLSSHSVFEFSATLYFVSPYRKYVLKLFTKYLAPSRYPSRVIQISASVSVTDAKIQQRRTTIP